MHQRRAQVGLRCVPIVLDQRMLPEQPLDGGSLHAPPAAVDQPDVVKARIVRGLQVLIDHGQDVTRRKCMQIDTVLDRDDKGVFLVRH